MELRQLEYVLALAELRSFTRAAERLHVVQSALSHQVKVLERELGVTLFARTSRRVELTDAGRAFLPEATAAVTAAARAVEAARDTGGTLSGRLAIGVIPTLTAVDLPAVLAAFARRHEQVVVTITTGDSERLAAQVAAGALDVAFLGLAAGVAPAGVHARELAVERLAVILPAGHPLATRARIRLADLADETFADFPAGTAGRRQSDLACAAAGATRTVGFEVASATHLLDLVSAGLCVALLAPSLVRPAQTDIRAVPVTDGPTRVQHAVWRSFNARRTAQAFLVEALGIQP